MTYRASGLLAGLSVNNMGSGVISGIIASNAAGTYAVTVTATDVSERIWDVVPDEGTSASASGTSSQMKETSASASGTSCQMKETSVQISKRLLADQMQMKRKLAAIYSLFGRMLAITFQREQGYGVF